MDKPLPPPFILEYPKPRWDKSVDPPPGEWLAWEMAGVKGWTLKCWPVFDAQIRWERHIRRFSIDINRTAFGMRESLGDAQHAAEAEIVRRVRAMLSAYRAIRARVIAQEGPGCRTITATAALAGKTQID